MPWTIYAHTLIADGRRYVGQTSKTMGRRWADHCRSARAAKGSRFFFANAIRKYGPEAFSHEVLQVCETLEEANAAEIAWIERLGTLDPAKGFNRRPGGKERLHVIARNPWERPGHREKMLAALNAPEATARMSEASRAAKSSPEFRAKVAAEVKARWADPERRAEIAAKQRAAALASHAADPTRAERAAATRRATLASRPARTAHLCGVHGPVPHAECYSKVRPNGQRVYECKTCVLAAQKRGRDAARIQRPTVRPMFRCRVHGDIPDAACFVSRKTGWRRCRACTLVRNWKAQQARNPVPLPAALRFEA